MSGEGKLNMHDSAPPSLLPSGSLFLEACFRKPDAMERRHKFCFSDPFMQNIEGRPVATGRPEAVQSCLVLGSAVSKPTVTPPQQSRILPPSLPPLGRRYCYPCLPALISNLGAVGREVLFIKPLKTLCESCPFYC